MSGEFGFPSRTAYCASKFAINGFFEALRAEVGQKNITITIVCPPSVKTDLRKHDLALSQQIIKKEEEEKENDDEKRDTRIEVEDCVKIIIEAADRKVRRIYFPFRAYIGVYLRPFFPDIVDHFALKEAKL